jgi:putative copper export protein
MKEQNHFTREFWQAAQARQRARRRKEILHWTLTIIAAIGAGVLIAAAVWRVSQ